MPLYEYQCEACAHRFERIQKFSDPLVETCPACGGKVRKLLSSPAFQFKGSGWYITDYARQGQETKGGDGDKPASSDQSDKSAKKTDSASTSSSSAEKPASTPAPAPTTKSE
jgi:putative FmdB family regulatory protein